ncbi:MAG: DoxX family protein [Sphingomonadales bacterium]
MKYLMWFGMAIVSLVMLMGGAAKLAGQESVLESYYKLGLPGRFGTFIGIAELAGAIGIWIRRTSLWAALGISVIMVGAIYYHVTFPPLTAGIPALILLLICGSIISQRGTGIFGRA